MSLSLRRFARRIEPLTSSPSFLFLSNLPSDTENQCFTSPLSSSFTFNSLLTTCSSLRELKQIHCQVLTSGSSQNLPLITKLINLYYLISSNMDDARQLFEEMPQRDIFIWNTLIRGYADCGPVEQAVFLYKQMHFNGVLPDNFTFPFVIRACAVLSARREGMQAHCNVIKCGLQSDVFVQTSLVAMYSQDGDTENSQLIFDEMAEKNTVSWTAMIAGYVQNGIFQPALEIFQQMIESGTKPNSVTLASVLPACSGLEFLNQGKLIHGYGIKLGLDSEISLANTLIAMYSKCKNVEIARSLFDKMPLRNLVSWNAIIAGYEQNDAGSEAIKLFRRMQAKKLNFDYITMVSVISACARLGALNTGIWVHELVDSCGLYSNISVRNALLDMYAKCGSIELARQVFVKLPQRNVVSWSSMISAYAAHGHGQDALKLFSQMQEEGVQPNGYTFIAVLTACSHSGLVKEGREHFDSMTRHFNVTPGPEHCSCMVDLLGRAGKLSEAYEFIKKMPIKPDVGIWGALLGACRIHKNIELAEIVAEHLFQLDPQTVTHYVLMSNIYAEAGRWEDFARLRKLMKEKQLRKIPGRSLIEINRRFHMFLSGPRLCSS